MTSDRFTSQNFVLVVHVCCVLNFLKLVCVVEIGDSLISRVYSDLFLCYNTNTANKSLVK